MGFLGQFMYGVILFELTLIAICAGGVAELLHYFDKSDHPVISFLIGAGCGVIVIWLAPFEASSAIVCGIVAIIGTIVGNIVLQKMNVPTAGDLVSDAFDNAADRERHYILHGEDAEKRIKNLRYHTNECHVIITSATFEQVYDELNKAIDGSSLSAEYPEARWEKLPGKDGTKIIQLTFSHAYIRLGVTPVENGARVVIYVDEKATSELKYGDSSRLMKKAETAWDSIYQVAKIVVMGLDAEANLTMSR